MCFVQLNRIFVPFRPTSEIAFMRPSLFGHHFVEKTWRDLLALYRVVVIAEANSGKSEEFRQMKDKLLSGGETTLLVPVEDLCDRKLDNCLPPKEHATFETWQSGSEVAYFFLDSVDEAKIKKKHFRAKLKTRKL